MDHILEFFHSYHNYDLWDIELHMLQDRLVVPNSSKFYTISTVLFHRYGGANVGITNFMSHFYMFVPSKDILKIARGNTGHAQGIGIILCSFTNFTIIYPMVPVYYFQFTLPTPYNWVPSNVMLILKRLHLNLLKFDILLTLKVILGENPTRWEQFRLLPNKNCQSQPWKKQEYFGTNCLWPIKIKYISGHSSAIWSCLYYQAKTNGDKSYHQGSTNKYPWLGRAHPCSSFEQVN